MIKRDGAFLVLRTPLDMSEVFRTEVAIMILLQTCIKTQIAITAFCGIWSLIEPGTDSKGKRGLYPRSRISSRRRQGSIDFSGGCNSGPWVLRVPGGVQPGDPHFEQRKVSPKLCKSLMGLELGEQKAPNTRTLQVDLGSWHRL